VISILDKKSDLVFGKPTTHGSVTEFISKT
jgi:hypothetical protein